VKEGCLSLVWLNAFADASTSACASTAGAGEKPGAIIPHKRSNLFGTLGFIQRERLDDMRGLLAYALRMILAR
jgi:hypothetical protein